MSRIRGGRGRGCAVGLLLAAWLLGTQPAQARSDIPGSADVDGLQRYPLSSIEEYQQTPAPEYRLALGPMKKVNGVISAERSEALAGQLTRITYRVPDGHGSDDAFHFMQRQLVDAGFTTLFTCEGRRCGSSNEWANTQFGIAQLYGIDRQQYYAAYRSGNGQRSVALYAVQRGNKRVYLQLDVINADASSSRSAVGQQLARGERLYVTLGDPLESLAAGLLRLAQRQPEAVIYLVGHSNRGATQAARLDSSRVDAERVRERLLLLGVPAALLVVQGVGDLAPAYDPAVPPIRVELVKEAP